MDITPYIQELIRLNECVILPGFGGFETSYKAAQYDNLNKTLLPPTKIIMFKPEYRQGNGVLESFLCAKLGISEAEAIKHIEDYVSQSWAKLRADRQIQIEGIGNLFYLPGNRFMFRHIPAGNYLVDSFGLTNVQVEKPVASVASPGIIKKTERSEEIVLPPLRTRNSKVVLLVGGVALVSLLLFIIFLASTYHVPVFSLSKDSKEQISDDLIVFGSREADTLVQSVYSQIDKLTSSKHALYYSDENTELNPDVTYFLVAGSFTNKINADELMTKLEGKGYASKMIFTTGFYRVVVGDFTDKSKALSELYRIRNSLDQSVWLMSVK